MMATWGIDICCDERTGQWHFREDQTRGRYDHVVEYRFSKQSLVRWILQG